MAQIENLKTALGFAIAFGMKIEDALLDDGKITTKEMFGFIPMLTKIPGLIRAIPHLKEEFTDLDEAEKAELNTWLAETLDLDNDKIEEYVEIGFSFLISLSEMVKINAPA
jgi:hypothetical protein